MNFARAAADATAGSRGLTRQGLCQVSYVVQGSQYSDVWTLRKEPRQHRVPFPPVFMPRTAELRGRRWLGATRASEKATSSVCDLLHSCSRDLAAGDKLDGLQAASQVQLHPFSKEYSKAALMAMRCADAMVDCLDTSTHLRDCPVAAEKPGLPAGDHIDAFVHAIKVHLHRNRGWSLC